MNGEKARTEDTGQKSEFWRGGWPWGSIWNEVDRPIRKITEGTSGCIVQSPRSWNAWVKERPPRHWSCGESSLTTSARMKRWECVAQRNCTATRPDATVSLKCN